MLVEPEYTVTARPVGYLEVYRVYNQRTLEYWDLVERIPNQPLLDFLALKDKYPEPDYYIHEVTKHPETEIDIWATVVRALLVLIPWEIYLLVWILILFLRACYRFVARGFKGS